MGLLDNLRNVLSGAGRASVPVDLEAGEHEIERFVASTLRSGFSAVGGDLVVTDRRLIFTPLNTADISALLKMGFKAVRAPSAVGVLVGLLQKQIDAAGSLIDGIDSASAGSNGSALRPPTVIIKSAGGVTAEFGVLHSRFEPTFSARNRRARDRLIALLQP